jgi:hypothetical protein
VVPTVDLLYVCSRFLWRVCFPLAWAAGTGDLRDRLYTGANAASRVGVLFVPNLRICLCPPNG